MKKSTKFFILTTVVNVILSAMIIWTTVLREARFVDIVTFYATAFGAGASVAALVVSAMHKKRGAPDPQP